MRCVEWDPVFAPSGHGDRPVVQWIGHRVSCLAAMSVGSDDSGVHEQAGPLDCRGKACGGDLQPRKAPAKVLIKSSPSKVLLGRRSRFGQGGRSGGGGEKRKLGGAGIGAMDDNRRPELRRDYGDHVAYRGCSSDSPTHRRTQRGEPVRLVDRRRR